MLAHSAQAQVRAQPTRTAHHASQPVEADSRTADVEDQVGSVAVEVQVEEEDVVEEVVRLHAEEARDREDRSRRGGTMDRSRLSRPLQSMLLICARWRVVS